MTDPLGEDVGWGSLPPDGKTGVGEPSFYRNLRNCFLILLVYLQHTLHIKETSNDTSHNLNGSNDSCTMGFHLLAPARRKFLGISLLTVSIRR